MTRNFKLLLTASTAAVLIVGLSSFWLGILHARRNVDIESVSVAQLGDAMQQDGFYSTYGDAALLFSGRVSSTKQNNNVTLVTFASTRPYSVSCEFPSTTKVTVGQTLSVAAPGGAAERESAGVLLHKCVNN